MCSTMENIHLFRVDALNVAIDRQHQRQPNDRLGGSQRHHKDDDALSPDTLRVEKMIKGHKVDIGRVKHQFDGHEDAQDIAPCERPIDTNGKKYGRKSKEVVKR